MSEKVSAGHPREPGLGRVRGYQSVFRDAKSWGKGKMCFQTQVLKVYSQDTRNQRSKSQETIQVQKAGIKNQGIKKQGLETRIQDISR